MKYKITVSQVLKEDSAGNEVFETVYLQVLDLKKNPVSDIARLLNLEPVNDKEDEPKLTQVTEKKSFNGLYKLRNRIVVEAWPEYNPINWSTPVRVVELPVDFDLESNRGWRVGQVNNLVKKSDDPMTWEGGAWGSDYDVVEKLS